MTYQVYIQINYSKKKVRKLFKVSKVIDFTHMKNVLTNNLRLRYRNMINFEIIDLESF